MGISAFDFQINRPSIENSFYNTAHWRKHCMDVFSSLSSFIDICPQHQDCSSISSVWSLVSWIEINSDNKLTSGTLCLTWIFRFRRSVNTSYWKSNRNWCSSRNAIYDFPNGERWQSCFNSVLHFLNCLTYKEYFYLIVTLYNLSYSFFMGCF